MAIIPLRVHCLIFADNPDHSGVRRGRSDALDGAFYGHYRVIYTYDPDPEESEIERTNSDRRYFVVIATTDVSDHLRFMCVVLDVFFGAFYQIAYQVICDCFHQIKCIFVFLQYFDFL